MGPLKRFAQDDTTLWWIEMSAIPHLQLWEMWGTRLKTCPVMKRKQGHSAFGGLCYRSISVPGMKRPESDGIRAFFAADYECGIDGGYFVQSFRKKFCTKVQWTKVME